MVISSKVSKRAVKRNRLRRLLHGHLRQRLESADLAGLWLLFSLVLRLATQKRRNCWKNATVF